MIERTIRIRSNVETAWQHLLRTLAVNNYSVKTQDPCRQIVAERGTKLSSLLLEGTKSGFRILTVTVSPAPKQEREYDFLFRFDFPSWALTLSQTRKDCLAMIEGFVELAEGKAASPLTSLPVHLSSVGFSGSLECQNCRAQNPADALFCANCGAKLHPAATTTNNQVSQELSCDACGASIPPDSKYCANCGKSLIGSMASDQ